MLPLFDMMLKAQNGEGVEALGKQFGLAQEQAAQAMAALMPAFSSGFKRSASNPYDMNALMSAMFSGAYSKYFEDMTRAFTPQGMTDGNAVLEKLFGSKDVSRAIAQQAEQFTGIGQEIFKKMMPVMADTLMGGLFKQMSGQMPGVGDAFSPMEKMARQWRESLGLDAKADTKANAGANPFDNPFAQAMRTMWGLEKTEQPQPKPNPFAENPFAKAFQDMMTGTFAPAAQPSAKPSEKAAPSAAASYGDLINQMFDSGIEAQKSYQKSMESIFDSYLGKTSPDAGQPK
jgi:hypothetical protein